MTTLLPSEMLLKMLYTIEKLLLAYNQNFSIAINFKSYY